MVYYFLATILPIDQIIGRLYPFFGACLIIMAVSIAGATLYCTHQPCVLCAKMIVNAGIVRVVYREGYPDEFSVRMLQEGGVLLERYEEDAPNVP